LKRSYGHKRPGKVASKKRDGLDSEYTNSTVNQTCQVLSTLICAWFPDGERPVETGDKVTIELTLEIGTRNLRFDSVGRRDSEVAFIPFEQRACLPKDGDSAMEIPADVRAALAEYAEE
jgi:hypothetical protein